MIKNFVKNNKWWTTLIAAVLIIILFFIFHSKKTSIPDTVVVEKRNITEEVSTTGNVKAISDLNLSFEIGGQVSGVNVSVGDRVYQGQILASLSNSDLVAAVEQAKAGLKIAEANLSTVQKGTRPEELNVAKTSFDDAKSTLNNKIIDAYTKADNAIRNDIDQMFDNPKTSVAKINIFINDAQMENDINQLRVQIETMLNNWNVKGSDIPLATAYSNLNTIKLFLEKMSYGANSLSTDFNIAQTTIDKYKTAVLNARSDIALAYSNLNIAESTYNSAKSNYNLKLAGNTQDAIDAQLAEVDQAKANVASAQAKLNKSRIVSPINGVITDVVAKIGQTMQSGTTAISVISYGKYNVESFVPEADIAKINVGNFATTTLDAYGSDTFFDTSVVKIDPAETIIENVPTYKVTLKFASTSDNRIKSGMTANLDILTGLKSGVLAVPSRSVYSVDNQKFVKLINSKNPLNFIETKIETGMRGVDGYVEIISGLKEGDKILASPNI